MPNFCYTSTMYSRVVVGFLALGLTAANAAAGRVCPHLPNIELSHISAEVTTPQFEPEIANADGYSSFRGLRLGLSRGEAQLALLRLKFTNAYPPSDRAIDFCAGQTVVGTIRFDENSRVMKLELRPAYFAVNKLVLREFADELFQHYEVRPLRVDDDNCFADITCFRGTTTTEEFLILRIATDVLVHVVGR